MLVTITVPNLGTRVDIDEVTLCPLCKHNIKPTFQSASLNKISQSDIRLAVTYLCPHCNNFFISQYIKLREPSGNSYALSTFDYVAPEKYIERVFEEVIRNVSPSFVKIYNQALAAENYNLDEIAGIGYRKALEFLIKDFLIKQCPENVEKVKNKPLGACINDYIEDTRLKTAASRAVWLGNDQTHYEQKFTDKDISDLKRLLEVTVHWVSMILLTEEAASIDPIK